MLSSYTLAVMVAAAMTLRLALALFERRAQRVSLAPAREALDAFCIGGTLGLAITTFVVRPYYIPSGSMEPTLQVHDALIVNEVAYRVGRPHFGEVAVFVPPIPSGDPFIKRVIGVPGDSIRVHHGVLYRNGRAVPEPEIAAQPRYELEIRDYGIWVDGTALARSQANLPPRSAWRAPDRIPEGFYLMMGDNRNDSDDSHIWGFAQLHGRFASGPLAGHPAGFAGKAMILCWPFTRARFIEPAVAAQP